MRGLSVGIVLLCLSNFAMADEFWQLQKSGTMASLRGISAVSELCCWASGAKGTVLRTVDGGQSWTSVGPPMAEAADFRDIHAWDDKTAIIMSAGDVDRLYRTEDGGKSWNVVFEEKNAAAFFDGMAFDQAGKSGWLMGDPLDGRVYLLRTNDEGRTWVRQDPEKSPQVANGIAAFAASGTHLLLRTNGEVLIGLGGIPEARPATEPFQAAVLRTTDQGESWKQINVPLRSDASSGIFSICDVSPSSVRVVAVGGDYRQLNRTDENVVVSDDGGIQWRKPAGPAPTGFRSSVVRLLSKDVLGVLITTGPSGTDTSPNSGESWERCSDEGFHTMSVSSDAALWAAGADGRVAKANLPFPPRQAR